MQVKNLIKQASRRLGIEVCRYRPETSDTAKLQKMLSHHEIDLVLDVGANTGQFARQLRRGGYQGKIVSFEPLSTAHRTLLQESKKDENWTIAPRMAIGDKDGTAWINISENSVSSSLQPMMKMHREVAATSRYIGKEETVVARLDSICGDYAGADSRIFLKIDTQGFERQVLDGAEKTLARIQGIQTELSLVSLYQEQSLFDELLARLAGLGFVLYGLFPCWSDPRTGRLLQVDGVLFRDAEGPGATQEPRGESR